MQLVQLEKQLFHDRVQRIENKMPRMQEIQQPIQLNEDMQAKSNKKIYFFY